MLSGSGVDVSIGDTIISADTQYSAQGFGVEGVEAKLLSIGKSPWCSAVSYDRDDE